MVKYIPERAGCCCNGCATKVEVECCLGYKTGYCTQHWKFVGKVCNLDIHLLTVVMYMCLVIQRPQSNSWRCGKVSVPDFHCDRCRDIWTRLGYQPEDCDRRPGSAQKDWRWKRSSSGKKRGGSGRRDSVDLVPPVNSVVSITDLTGSRGRVDSIPEEEDKLKRTLSTIAGSEVGDLLRSSGPSRIGFGSEDVGDGADATSARGAAGSRNSNGVGGGDGKDGLDPRAFTGADGKTYVPDELSGDYHVQDIPPHDATGKHGKKTKKSRRCAKSALPQSSSTSAGDNLGTDQVSNSATNETKDLDIPIDEQLDDEVKAVFGEDRPREDDASRR